MGYNACNDEIRDNVTWKNWACNQH